MNLKCCLLAVALATAASSGLDAADGDPLTFIVGQGVTVDSNLFRLPEGTVPAGAETGETSPHRGDMFFKTYGGVNLDKPFRRQQLKADFTLTHYAYRTYDYLNFTGVSGRGGWDWVIGRRWKGAVSYERSQAPSTDATQTGFQTAYQLYQRLAGEADYRWRADWSWGGSVAKISNSANYSLSAFADYAADVADAHLTYRPRSNNQVRLLVRRTAAHYTNRLLDPSGDPVSAYTQNDVEAEANWALSSHSRIVGRLGYSGVNHQDLSLRFRNRNSPGGRVVYDWKPTDKTTVSATVRRDIGPELGDTLNANFDATSAGSIAISSALSPKITVRGLAERRIRNLSEAAGARSDVLSNPGNAYYRVTGIWTVMPALLLNVTVGREARTGDNPAFPHYSDHVVSADLQVMLR